MVRGLYTPVDTARLQEAGVDLEVFDDLAFLYASGRFSRVQSPQAGTLLCLLAKADTNGVTASNWLGF